jgi:hypothetical protein
MERDPEKKKQFDEALDFGVARLEQLAHERCFQPDVRPIFDKNGNLLDVEKRYDASNRMILRNLTKRDREWSERKDVSGQVNVSHTIAPARGFTFTQNDIAMLTSDEADTLWALMEKCEAERLKREDAKRLPPADSPDDFVGEIVTSESESESKTDEHSINQPPV